MMADPITVRGNTSLGQASTSSDLKLDEAVESSLCRLRGSFGENHPDLIAPFMETAALDSASRFLARAFDGVALILSE